MSEKELWEYFNDKKMTESKPFDRIFLWISNDDFSLVKEYFVKEFNLLHPGSSYRSKSLWKHIHAVTQEDSVFVHIDTGNMARFFPLGLFHFVFDVVPYVYFSFRNWIPMREIFKKPN